MKKFRILCAAAIIGLIPTAAMAADTPMLIAENPMDNIVASMPENAGVEMLSSFGEVEEVASEYVVVKLDEGASVARVQLNITEESAILDNVTAKGIEVLDIKVGDRVFAYFDDKMTKSIPAQSALIALFTNVEDSTPALVWTVEEVAHSNGSSKILTVDNGNLLLTVDTDFDIKAGSRIAAWYETVMMSLPAQAVADRVALLTSVDTANVEETQLPEQEEVIYVPNSVKVNGEALDVTVEKVGEQVCVPLRAVAEKLGYKLTWDADRMTANISKDGVTAAAAMGSNTLVVDGDMAYDLGAEIYLQNKQTMFVPVSMFEKLGLAVKVGNELEIGVAVISADK